MTQQESGWRKIAAKSQKLDEMTSQETVAMAIHLLSHYLKNGVDEKADLKKCLVEILECVEFLELDHKLESAGI